MSPYRTSAPPPDPPRKRWGVTPWRRLVTCFPRLLRALRRIQAQHEREARLDAAHAREVLERTRILQCWEQMRTDAGFLYAVQCTCGHHTKKVDGKGRRSWAFVRP